MNAIVLSLALTLAANPTPPEGVLPVGRDGKPLNFDFETGTLKDWTAEGDAFRDQPIKGDTVHPRRGDMRSNHQGQYWIGGYEKYGDKPQGTLTSVPFKVTHPWASFLIGGGAHSEETCVELFHAERKYVIHRAAGLEEEDMRREVVDLSRWIGHELQIRLVDRHSGHWGHLNFDDFRFHSEKPNFPPRPVRQAPPPPDAYKYAGLPPEKAAAVMTVPEGFHVTLFAGEPDVHQPVGFCIDDRGRLWVAEAYTYPRRHPHPGPILPDSEQHKGDRIIIFEDTNGDGQHDKRTVFMEGLNLVSGIEVGFGGVWIGAAPYLLFVPHDPKTDKPAGEPQILLDGWGYQDTHETLNTFIWGPDGWLYGCHGVFTHSNVGKPGTPNDQRVKINAGIWRYHPTRHVFEVYAEGTSNPWGLDYNDYGDWFIEACVIPHCFHIVQGGRYHRQAGQHFNPYTYADIQTIADHRHYVGPNPHGGNNRSDSMGGGHAHCGLMCYLGGTWPKEYRGQLFMGNIHGRRLNVDIPKPKGSSYVASHGKDFLLANDAWARFINLRYGPDGNVYLIDWYDKQACHHNDPNIWDRTNGRIYKISYKGAKPVVGLDLQKCSDEELVKYQLHENDWYVRHARRILQERAAELSRDAERGAKVRSALEKIALKHPDETRRLRGLWALHAVSQVSREVASSCLLDKSPYVRAWIHTVLGDGDYEPIPFGRDFYPGLESEHPVVRRHYTSALIRGQDVLEVGLSYLLKAAVDGDDPNLPYLYWYALEPLAGNNPVKALEIAAEAKIAQLLPFTARRIAAIGTPEAFDILVAAILKAEDASHIEAYLRGLQEGLRGRRDMAVPKDWPAAFAKASKADSPAVRSLALTVGVALRDPAATDVLLAVVNDNTAETAARQTALAALLDVGPNRLGGVLKQLVTDPAMRSAAIRGMARIADDRVPEVLLANYDGFSAQEKRDVVNTLAARPAYGHALLDAIEAKKIPAADVPAEIIRQLRNLNDKALDEKIAAVWGTVRATPADRQKLIASWQKRLSTPNQSPPDLALGRAVYARVCQQCHTLYGVGGTVGPDITGANRADLNYLLENIFDPSAVIPKEYAATKLDLIDGRVITGIIKEETQTTLTVVTANETLTIPTADVDRRTPSELSMMPDDLTKQATEEEIRALIAYLRHPQQVPMKATPENAKEFFNGKDLTGWDADPKLWKVENGEIVGKTEQGLKHNNFAKGPLEVSDFKLTLKVKLVPNTENSGIQFRSETLEDGEMRGPQADIGKGWWGKLYDENGRGLLAKEDRDHIVKVEDWNEYIIEAKGTKVRTWINGQLCVDLEDEKLARKGLIAFQLHSGGPMEVRFKDIMLEVFP
jgi:putative membrane-bound dehydrogenase-like protein